ncbi:hypothetical protein U1Q18_026139, partial [Sarracenia purpurea var. burkii]
MEKPSSGGSHGDLVARSIPPVTRIEGREENNGVRSAAMTIVKNLIDGYLSEIASDAYLKSKRFYQLVIALPNCARFFDDDLYGFVDVYLK